jgi:hypothetical protein
MIYKVQKMSIDAFQKSDKRIRFALRRQDISCERTSLYETGIVEICRESI